MFTSEEKRTLAGITFAVVARMLGLFLLLPVLAPYVKSMEGSTPVLTGIAVGIYGLTQAVLQIPFGYLSDKFGRKPVITFGFIAYIFGSILGGIAHNIWSMIVARLIQGGGAISSAAVSLAADLIREEVRTRAFAQIGASVGMVFAFSITVAPILAGKFGVPFIFYLTAFLSCIAMLYILFFIKEPKTHHKEIEPSLKNIGMVLKDRSQVMLNLSVGILHALLVSIFTVIPIELINRYNLPKPEHWKLYLPIILVSIAVMVPSTILAEKKGRIREVFLSGIVLIGLGFISHLIFKNFTGVVSLLLLYFIGFHLLEPIMPSLLTKLSHKDTRGLAVGVYNTSQFIGAFLGGAMGGVFLKLGTVYMLTFNSILSLIWLFTLAPWILSVRGKG
ncbi:putative MFS family arabinose efflux permease [Hydrogenivirga caldilitoris]|uniref:Putative MFS family arabinose efflux permease n=1 Tax=Hydrogenivirga caldilitoris TaxID=246264 RepID=A0A497XQ22_9AQUI|nr:MFS transporter [Hydrogenivirga caldilitoris]RLJ70219.1 putative MFS family arabinose efflux permease [Hydrogenivirga caldilitoris]